MSNEIVKAPEVQIVNVADARDAMRAFERFKVEVLSDNDFYQQGDKRYVRKSGWMKYAMALGISTEVFDEVCQTVKFNGVDVLVYNFTAKASAPSGRFAIAVGSASSDEGKPWAKALHSIRAMAQTRAVERAISNLVGGGEVGADELDTKTVEVEFKVKPRDANNANALHDAHDEDAAISLEQDIIEAIEGAKLDPNGVEITRGREWGEFIIKPLWGKDAPPDTWRKYADVLAPFQVKYHGAKEKDTCKPEHLYNWTIGVA